MQNYPKTLPAITHNHAAMEPSTNVKLFGMWASPFVLRVEIALKLKGVKYEYVQEDLTNKSPSLLRYNPVYKKVPVLLHDGRPIAESIVILEYIDDVWKQNPLLPRDPYERAIVRFWCHFATETLQASGRKMYVATGEEQKAAAIQENRANMGLLETELREGIFKGKRFFGGNQIGILDLILGCNAHWMVVFEEFSGAKLVDPESFPRLHSLIRDFLGLDVVKEVIPDLEKLTDYARALVAKMVQVQSQS